MRGKYAPLHRHLSNLDAREWATTFREIERILSAKLPPSAHTYREWWANDRTHTQAIAWMLAGWKHVSVDLRTETVVFRRVGPSFHEARRLRSDVQRACFSDHPSAMPMRRNPDRRDRANVSDHYEMPFDLDRLMHGLSQARPIFHSREDFRHSRSTHSAQVTVRLSSPIEIPDINSGKEQRL